MARKKKSAGSGLLAFVFVIQAVALFFTFISPAIIAAMWLFSEIRTALALSRLEQGMEPLEKSLERQATEFRALIATGTQDGLMRRQDGFFDGRSTQGKMTNEQMSRLLRDLQSDEASINHAHKLIAQRAALRSAVFVWIASSGFLWLHHDQTFNSMSFLIAGSLASVIALLVYFILKDSVAAELNLD